MLEALTAFLESRGEDRDRPNRAALAELSKLWPGRRGQQIEEISSSRRLVGKDQPDAQTAGAALDCRAAVEPEHACALALQADGDPAHPSSLLRPCGPLFGRELVLGVCFRLDRGLLLVGRSLSFDQLCLD